MAEEDTVPGTGRPPGRPPVGPRVTTNVAPDLAALLRERAATRDQALAAAVREAIERGVAAIRAEEEQARTP